MKAKSAAPLLLVGLLSGSIGLAVGWWWSRPQDVDKQRRAYVQYLIDTSPRGLLDPTPMDAHEADRLRATQAAFIKSPLVLQGALGADGGKLTKLPVFEGMDGRQQVEWLRERVVARYPSEGDLLEIAVVHPTASREDLFELVKGIAQSYNDYVIFEDDSRRKLPLAILQRSHRELEEKLEATLLELTDLSQPKETLSIGEEAAEQPEDAVQPEDESLRERNALQREVKRLSTISDELWLAIKRLRIDQQEPSRFRPIGVGRGGKPAADFYGAP